MSETSTSASLAAATAAASPGLNWADDVDDELKPSSSTAAKGAGGDDDDDAPPGFEHVSPAGGAADPAEALVAKIGGVAVGLVQRRRKRDFSKKKRQKRED